MIRTNRKHGSVWRVIALLVPLALLVACGGQATAPTTQQPPTAQAEAGANYKIAFVVANINNTFYLKAIEGAKEEAAQLGVELLVQGPQEFSPEQQVPVVEALLAQSPDAIAIAVADPTALNATLQRYVDANIPIVAYDAILDAPFSIVSQIESANQDGGAMAADELVRQMGESGTVGVIDLNTSNKVTLARRDGFLGRMADAYPDVEVLDVQYTQLDFASAQTIAQTYLNQYPDLTGIFATFSPATEFAAKGIEDLGAQDQVTIVGYEASAEEIEDIRSGTLNAVVAQQPAEEGKLAVRYAYYALTGKTDEIESHVQLPQVVINGENVDDMKEYYYGQ